MKAQNNARRYLHTVGHSLSKKEYHFVKQFRKISVLHLPFFDCLDNRRKKLECAQAARALPFPLGRKRKQKGPFCTARRQREDGATLKPVRRTFPNSTIHIVSNTWEGSFLPLPCAAGVKIPSRATQIAAAGAASASRQRPAAHKDAGSVLTISQLVGKARMEMKVGLTFACMNLKRLAKLKAKRGLLEKKKLFQSFI